MDQQTIKTLEAKGFILVIHDNSRVQHPRNPYVWNYEEIPFPFPLIRHLLNNYSKRTIKNIPSGINKKEERKKKNDFIYLLTIIGFRSCCLRKQFRFHFRKLRQLTPSAWQLLKWPIKRWMWGFTSRICDSNYSGQRRRLFWKIWPKCWNQIFYFSKWSQCCRTSQRIGRNYQWCDDRRTFKQNGISYMTITSDILEDFLKS